MKVGAVIEIPNWSGSQRVWRVLDRILSALRLVFQVHENPEEENLTPEKVLEKVCEMPEVTERLQIWDADKRELAYACGDGRNCVYVNSSEKLTHAHMSFKTKLTRASVEKFQKGTQKIDGTVLFNRIIKILKDYLHCDDTRVYPFLAVYILATYVYSIFSHAGYLFIYSSQPRSGKTRLLEVVSHLAFEASHPTNSPTPASLRELATNGRTVQLDSVERWKDRDSFSTIMEILDAGFRNGGEVSKMVPTKNGGWQWQTYPVYAPYCFAGIKKESLSDTAIDRSFPIEAKQKPITIRKKRYSHSKCEKDCGEIREDCYLWGLQNALLVSLFYEHETPAESLGLNDRAVDIWRPLFAVLEALGFKSNSPEWVDLQSLATEMHLDPEQREIQRQLDLIDVLLRLNRPAASTSEIEKELGANGIQMKQSEVTRMLQKLGLKQENKRIDGQSRRVWLISAQKLSETAKELKALCPLGAVAKPINADRTRSEPEPPQEQKSGGPSGNDGSVETGEEKHKLE